MILNKFVKFKKISKLNFLAENLRKHLFFQQFWRKFPFKNFAFPFVKYSKPEILSKDIVKSFL